MVKEINQCIDAPDSRDYCWENFEEFANGKTKQRPQDDVTVQNQGSVWACTRFGIVHIVNGNNILEYKKEWYNYQQIDAMEVWLRGNQQPYLQIALKQMKDEWLIQWYVVVNTEEQMKKALDMWYFIYTGSSNWDWTATKKSKIYSTRADGKFVWHAFALVWYNTTGWIAINSYWPKWANKGYFTIPFKYTSSLYTRYAIIDKTDNFAIFKVKEKAFTLQKLNSEFYNLTTNIILQGKLHDTNEILRSGQF